jgi:hypothetical protein
MERINAENDDFHHNHKRLMHDRQETIKANQASPVTQADEHLQMNHATVSTCARGARRGGRVGEERRLRD